MKCYECGGNYKLKSGSLEFTDRFIGDYPVENIKYHKCDNCGDMLFSPEALKKIETTRSKILDDMLQNMPLSDFISGTNAARKLGICL